ncbi:MAG: type II toxin-antitoxin system Phd/YefM family antitoxin [Negativicutes bacterium]|jgi:hypothetical protein
MLVNTDTLIPITEANRNFSKVARLVDKKGAAIILKNNVPRYLIVEFNAADSDESSSDETIMAISARLIAKNRKAYAVLAQ